MLGKEGDINMKTGYPLKGIREALIKSLAFIDIIESNGYDSVFGSCSSYNFEKTIDKDSYFMLMVSTQLSGYIRVDLAHWKDKIKTEEYLCCDAESLSQKIKDFEKKFS